MRSYFACQVLLLTLLLAGVVPATGQSIQTTAGSGSVGYSGDNGPAIAAQISNPAGIAVASATTYYVADAGNRRIRKVSNGFITTVAGSGAGGNTGDGGPATLATFDSIRGLALNATATVLYVADKAAHVVRKIDLNTGIISTVAGTGVGGYLGDGGAAIAARLNGPMGVAVAPNGDLLIADQKNHRIRKVDGSGIISTVVGTGVAGSTGNNGQATSAKINSPAGLAALSNGGFYFSEQGSHVVRIVKATGIVSAVAGTINGLGYVGDGGPATAAKLNSPTGLAVDADGSLYIADRGNHAVRKILAGTTIITAWAGNGTAGFSGDGGPAASAQLNIPAWVGSTPTGALFIADQGNNRIRSTNCVAPAQVGSITGPVSVCTGTNSTFSVSPVAHAANYSWSLPTGFGVPASTNSITVSSGSTGTVSVTASNACGVSGPSTMSVTNNTPSGIITTSGPLAICSGGSVPMDAPTGFTTYQWKKGSSNLSGATTASYSATSAGSYTVVVTNQGCTATLGPVVVTTATAAPTTIAASGPTSVCSGSEVTLGTTATGTAYQWKKSNVDIPGATSNTYVANVSGSYKLVITNPGNCISTSNSISVTVNATPTVVASLTGGTGNVLCTGSKTLSSSGSSAGSRQWYLDGMPIPGATGTTYSATAGGSYTLSVTTTAGCSDTSDPVVIIQGVVPATPVITAGGPTQVCIGDSVVLDGTTANASSYQWYQGSTLLAGATAPTYAATVAGSYKVTAYGPGGYCSATSALKAVQITPVPVAEIIQTGTQIACFGSNIQLKSMTTTGAQYQWSRNGVNISPGGTGSIYNANQNGDYTVTVSKGGCVNTSAPVTVVIEPLPNAIVTTIGNDTICQGDSALLSVGVGPGYSYQWYYNGDTIPNATAPLYYASSSGNYTVSVTSSNGCMKTSLVYPITQVPASYSQITYSSPIEFCEGGAVVLTASTGQGDSVKYQWLRDFFNLPGDTLNYLVAGQSGLYTLSTTNEYHCVTQSGPIQITAHPHPIPTITITNNILSTTSGYQSYKWYYNGSVIPGAISYSTPALGNGAYQVYVWDANGCDGYSATFFMYNGVDVETLSPHAAGVRAYPNPAVSTLFVESIAPCTLRLVSMDGKVLTRTQNPAYRQELNISTVAPGQYLLIATDGDGRVVRTLPVLKTGG